MFIFINYGYYGNYILNFFNYYKIVKKDEMVIEI